MMNNIESGGILRCVYFIKVQAEGEIYRNNDNLPTPENIPVSDKELSSQSILNNKFRHNEFCHSRMEY